MLRIPSTRPALGPRIGTRGHAADGLYAKEAHWQLGSFFGDGRPSTAAKLQPSPARCRWFRETFRGHIRRISVLADEPDPGASTLDADGRS